MKNVLIIRSGGYESGADDFLVLLPDLLIESNEFLLKVCFCIRNIFRLDRFQNIADSDYRPMQSCWLLTISLIMPPIANRHSYNNFGQEYLHITTSVTSREREQSMR